MDGHTYFPDSHEEISSLLGRLPSSSSSREQMTLGAASAGHLGAERRKSLTDQELDSLDCDLEDAAEVSDDPAKVPPTRSSSSKRNRAAEVHNLSEKRRRSRINEKMKALQSLIPNSSKTDKASMLDEAIEYLKQLQLQVQMLSMRNSLNQHPLYLHGALQPLQTMQLASNNGLDAERAMATGLEMLPLNQGSSVSNSFNLPTSSHLSAFPPSAINMTRPETSFAMESSQSHPGSFLFPVSIEDILTREGIPHQQSEARHFAQNHTGTIASQHSRGQPSSMVVADLAQKCTLGTVRSEDFISGETEKEKLIQHLPH
ncbi:transcription factor ALC-like isoform X1 [Zingiber officinale]|uniref:BHLH domain-containing protein n=1 Tax=Zingiber officinale TaxID=94328 RepID=A0A8J5GZ47_ZINOF|nr:transcription factor ALC-like isoform X1 [Zingiber officinale]KAG6513096.1 hypothetical protein ZIOFF_023403 [Zingiber officinale]